jgi:hypothetical protein
MMIFIYPVIIVAYIGFSVASFRAYKKAKTKLLLLEFIGSLMVVVGATVVFISELAQ